MLLPMPGAYSMAVGTSPQWMTFKPIRGLDLSPPIIYTESDHTHPNHAEDLLLHHRPGHRHRHGPLCLRWCSGRLHPAP